MGTVVVVAVEPGGEQAEPGHVAGVRTDIAALSSAGEEDDHEDCDQVRQVEVDAARLDAARLPRHPLGGYDHGPVEVGGDGLHDPTDVADSVGEEGGLGITAVKRNWPSVAAQQK